MWQSKPLHSKLSEKVFLSDAVHLAISGLALIYIATLLDFIWDFLDAIPKCLARFLTLPQKPEEMKLFSWTFLWYIRCLPCFLLFSVCGAICRQIPGNSWRRPDSPNGPSFVLWSSWIYTLLRRFGPKILNSSQSPTSSRLPQLPLFVGPPLKKRMTSVFGFVCLIDFVRMYHMYIFLKAKSTDSFAISLGNFAGHKYYTGLLDMSMAPFGALLRWWSDPLSRQFVGRKPRAAFLPC